MMGAVVVAGLLLAAQPVESPPASGMTLVEQRLVDVRNAPEDPRARLELGLAYVQVEEYDFAMAELVEAIRLNPDNTDNLAARANFHLGSVLLAMERPKMAINAFREALKMGWKDASVYLGLGQALTSQAKFDDAIAQYREALRLDPNAADAYAGMGLAFEGAGRADDAVTQYEQYLRAAPSAGGHGAEAIKQRLAKLKERRRM